MRMRNQDAWFTHKRALNFQGGSSSQATNPWGAGATAHRSLKPKKTRAWDPERDFCQDDPGNETLWPGTKGAGTAVFQAVQTSGKLKTAGHTYQKLCCVWPWYKAAAKRRAECWCLLSFQQPCYLPKSNCPRKMSLDHCLWNSTHVIHYHAPSQLDPELRRQATVSLV